MEQALKLIETCGEIHLLVSNYNMPKMNGVELARRLRAKHERLTVLLITGDPPDIDPIEDIEVLPKPYNEAKMLGKVRELLRRATA